MKITHRKITAHADIPADEPKKSVKASGRYYVTPEITEMDLKLAAESVAKSLKKMDDKTITTEYVIDRLRSLSDFWDEYWAYGLRTREDEKEFLYDFLGRLEEYGVTDVIDDTFDEDVKGSVDTGLDYWYFSRHGMGPGTIPRDVQVIDWYEEGYKTWMKLDKMLTTEELNEYNIKEEVPPVGSITHNGDEIVACDSITGSEDVPYFYDFSGNVQEPEASELVRFRNRFYGDYLDSYDQKSVLDGWCYCVGRKDDEEGYYWRSFTPENWEKVKHVDNQDIYSNYPEAPLRDDLTASTDVKASDVKKIKETDNTIEYVVSCDDVEGNTLINYKDYRIVPDYDLGGWNVFNSERDLIKQGLESEFDAKDYVDSITSSTDVEGNSSIKISNIDLEVLKSEITEGCLDYLCGPEGGFKRPGEPREDKWDMYATDMFVVEVESQPEEYRIKVEVRAELGYSSMEKLSAILDPIVANYDSDAYFEMVEPGIMEAYLYDPDAPAQSDDWDSFIEGSEEADGDGIEATSKEDAERLTDEVIRRHDDDFDPDYTYDESDEINNIEDEFDFEVNVEVYDDGSWKISEGDALYHADADLLNEIGESEVLENFTDILEWHVPSKAGKYKLRGKAKLVYEPDLDGDFHFAPHLSVITDLKSTNAGKVESSTKVEATMTEEDLDRAIQEGKPFDLESFKKWKTPGDPNAILAEQVEVGDVIDNQSDASEINLDTVFKVLAINDPAEDWIDYTFRVEILEHDGKMQDVEVGTVTDLHYSKGDEVGYIVPM